MPQGWPDFGGIVDPRDNARIRLWLDTLAAAQARDDPLPAPAQPQYRTGCPACYVAMCEHDVDVGMNPHEKPLFCSHHQRAVAEDLWEFDVWELTSFLTNLRAWVMRTR